MSPSIHPGLLALAVLLTGVVGFPEIVIENEDMGMLSRSGVEPPGDLWCDAGEAEYRVPDEDIFRLAFTNEAAWVGAWVEKVQMGPVNAAPCLGLRYPAFGPTTFPKSTNVAVHYRQCGYSTVYSEESQTITHSNLATIVLRLPSPSPWVIKRKTYTVPLHCVGSAVGGVIVNTQYFQHVIAAGPIFEQFGVSVSVKVRKDNRIEFLGERNASVNVITVVLDHPDQIYYDIIGHRCWATPTASPVPENPLQQLEFVSARGCNTDATVSVLTAFGTEKYIYEVGDFALDDSGQLYFHCEINACFKNIQSNGHCTKSSACSDDGQVMLKSKDTLTSTMTATSPVLFTDKRVSAARKH